MLIYLDTMIVQYCVNYKDFTFGDSSKCVCGSVEWTPQVIR